MIKLPGVLLLAGVLVGSSALILGWAILPSVIKNAITNNARLEYGTSRWEHWRSNPVPIYFKVYFFNVTNPGEVENGEKPILNELGPYVYEEKREKIDIEVIDEIDTVQYRQSVHYFFRQDLSNGTEDDVLTFLNIPLIGIAKEVIAYGMNKLQRIMFNMFLMKFKERLFVQRTVQQLLFQGYRHDFLAQLNENLGIKFLPNNTFGIMYGKNGSNDGEYEVYSGVKDFHLFGKILIWNGVRILPWWDGDYCNMINGSDGSLFTPHIKRTATLRIYNSDLCRSLHLTYDKDAEFKGVRTYRFTIPKEVFEDPRKNPNNLCFCPNPGENYDGCLKAGAIQLSYCRKGAPVIASTPHFLDGDKEYLDSSIGLNPIRENHETFIELEPKTGIVVQASKRVQINVDLKPTSVIPALARAPQMIFPIFWADEYVALTDDKANEFQAKLLLPDVVKVWRKLTLAFSALMTLSAVVVFIIRMRNINVSV